MCHVGSNGMNTEKLSLADLDTEEANRCVLCGNETPEPDNRFRKLLALTGPYNVLRCSSCGLAWLSPRPTASAYDRIYAYESYFDGNGALEEYADVAGSRNVHFVKRLERIASLLPGMRQPRLLDIGAATGDFVHAAAGTGFDAAGMEISAGAREEAQRKYGISLLPGPLEAVARDHVFDVIHLNHVLEHLAEPVDILETCYRMLAPGGLLVIEVPQQFNNDLDRIRFSTGLRKPVFNSYSLHHIYFFDPENLTAMIRKAGFDVESVATANPNRTPLWPFSISNWILRVFLAVSDRLRQGGNIIEVYGRKPA